MRLRIGLMMALSLGWIRGIPPVQADDPPALSDGGVTDLDLQGQLEKGLKARRPVEFAYIAEIVDLVKQNKLPRDLVDSTFGWARKKRTKRLQYFQFALQTRASALNIATPNLDNQGISPF